MIEFDVIVVGCGLSGAVVARQLADSGRRVLILEKRDHIAGNMFDYIDEHGILVHKYGPHTFHTNNKELYNYISKYSKWFDYRLKCGAEINGICTPTPFNFKTIDQFYSQEEADELKKHIKLVFGDRKTATVVEALDSKDKVIKKYAQFLFDNDYSLYTAKQWGLSASEIDPSVLKRVPLRFSYDEGYFDDKYQVMPHHSYTEFFNGLLDSDRITVRLNTDALDMLSILSNNQVEYNGSIFDGIVVFTGALDALFNYRFGKLPYRSLRFEWHYENIESKQQLPVVAYPQAEGFTRIVEYSKLPVQKGKGTTYEIEYSFQADDYSEQEPYYPVLTKYSQYKYELYKSLAGKVKNLYLCGRLAEFKYYNMDQALQHALEVSEIIVKRRII